MTSIRKWFYALFAAALMALALPSIAANPQKIFGLTMSGTLVPNSLSTITAKYTNLTPSGNSTINWVYLIVPNTLGPISAANVTFPQGGSVFSITPGATTTTIIVNNIPGVGTGGATWSFNVNVNVPANPTCVIYHFDAQAFTGNSGTQGQPFAYQSVWPAPPQVPTFVSTPDLAITSGCSLQFTTQPASASVGATITSTPYNTPAGTAVQVTVMNGASPATAFTGPVSVAITPGTGTTGAVLSGNAPVNAVAGVATFSSLSINTAGVNYQLRASIGTPFVDSNAFWITPANGTVNCTDSNYASSDGVTDPDLTYVDFLKSNPQNWGVRRGPNSLDGSNNNCQKVGISVTFNGSVVQFLYDKSIPNQVGNFKYWIVWPETTVNPLNTQENSFDGTTQRSTASYGEKRPLVSWNAGVPIYVPALNCASDDLTQGSALMPILPNVSPFNDAGQISDYAYDGTRKAKACIAEHVMISSGISGGVFQVIYADKFVDQVDTLFRQP